MISCTETTISDQIIEGLLDDDTVEDLLQETDLTLTKTIHKFQTKEAAKKQQATLLSTSDTMDNIRNDVF